VSNRIETVVASIVEGVHGALVRNDVTSDEFRQSIKYLRENVASDEFPLLTDGHINRAAMQAHAKLLLGLLVNGRCRSDAVESSREHAVPAAIYRAEAYIEAHVTDAITLDDIAAAARAPVRTLLDGFRRFRDTSPMQHLRSVRLNLARERLLSDQSASIASIALECGFGNLGRFAKNYAERFGERPSETRVGSRRRK
jgi:transcriptional regulator GlxA family with amidase domain